MRRLLLGVGAGAGVAAFVGLGAWTEGCSSTSCTDTGTCATPDGGGDATGYDSGPPTDGGKDGAREGGGDGGCDPTGTPATTPCVISNAVGVFVAPPANGGS